MVKMDFWIYINCQIVDSAFTMASDTVYDNLVAAVKNTTNTGVKVSTVYLPNQLNPSSIQNTEIHT